MSGSPPFAVRGRAMIRLTPVYLVCCLPGLAVLLYWAVCYFQRTWSVLTFPYGYDYGEAPELNRALAVAHLQAFYPFWNTPPYQMANYTPLFSVLNGLFVRFLGVQFQSGRAIAWVCGLLFCAGLGWLAWREGKTGLAPVVTVLLWFCSHYVWNWTPLGREDELAMLCSVGGLIVFYEGVVRVRHRELGVDEYAVRHHSWAAIGGVRQDRRWSVGAALILFLAAMYTRQTTIEAAAACAIYLLVLRPRLGVAFVAGLALMAGLIFVLVDVATRGAFYLNVVIGNVNLYHGHWVVSLGHEFWQYYQGAAVLAAFYVVTQLFSQQQQLFVLWLLLTFAVSITAGKEGASDNYGLLPWGATCLAAGLAVARAQAWTVRLWGRRWPFWLFSRPTALLLPVLIGFTLLLQAQLVFHLPYEGSFRRSTTASLSTRGGNALLRRWTDSGWYRRLLPGEPGPQILETTYGLLYKPSLGPADRQEQHDLDALVAAAPGDVFDEDMTHVLLAGKRIYIQPFEFSEEARLGRWDQRPFLQTIEQRRFGLVVTTRRLTPTLQFSRYTPEMMAALTVNYCLMQQTANYFVYQPCAAGTP
jgi:hypothetical protein